MTILLFLLIPLAALLLTSAQALWRSAVVDNKLMQGSISTIFFNTIASPKIWAGIFLYVATTGLYLFLLSRFKFFVVQLTVTGLALIFSVIFSHFIFHEKISVINLVGLAIILVGVVLVLQR